METKIIKNVTVRGTVERVFKDERKDARDVAYHITLIPEENALEELTSLLKENDMLLPNSFKEGLLKAKTNYEVPVFVENTLANATYFKSTNLDEINLYDNNCYGSEKYFVKPNDIIDLAITLKEYNNSFGRGTCCYVQAIMLRTIDEQAHSKYESQEVKHTKRDLFK